MADDYRADQLESDSHGQRRFPYPVCTIRDNLRQLLGLRVPEEKNQR